MKWLKDNGQEIETNDAPATVVHCESIGWKQVKKPQLTDEEKAAKKDAAAEKKKAAAEKKAAAKTEADAKKPAE